MLLYTLSREFTTARQMPHLQRRILQLSCLKLQCLLLRLLLQLQELLLQIMRSAATFCKERQHVCR